MADGIQLVDWLKEKGYDFVSYQSGAIEVDTRALIRYLANDAGCPDFEELVAVDDDGNPKESLKLNCNVRCDVIDEEGNIVSTSEGHNLICTIGKNTLLAATSAEYINQYKYAAIGTGTTAPAITDTAMQTEVARVTGVLSNPTSSSLQIVATYAAGTVTGNMSEFGLFDASSSGNMLAHQTATAQTITSGWGAVVTWTIS